MEKNCVFVFLHFWECLFFHRFLMVFSPGGVFGGTLGGPQGVLGALLCLHGPEGLPKGSPRGLQGVPQGPPRGPSRGRWEALGTPGSAKTNSEEGSARACILMVSLLYIGIHLLT